MKKFLVLAILALTAPLATNYVSAAPANETETVYICNGPCSKKYHKISNCKGLGKCSTRVEAVTKEQAKSMGRTPCKLCYKH